MSSHPKIRVAIAGVGNCASSLVQGIDHYASGDTAVGLAFPSLGGYRAADIEIVAAFDIDARKVGKPLDEALLAAPNNTLVFRRPNPRPGVVVRMGPVLDGVPDHMSQFPPGRRYEPASLDGVDVSQALRDSGAEVLVSYMPVGAHQATCSYAQACLDAGVGFINCVPVFVVSDPAWAARFAERGLPCVGDDIKAQLGATITHRALARLFEQRGVRIDSTYQLNVGGNTDFLNMLNRARLASKRISKTDAVQSQLRQPLEDGRIHIGPSDFVPFLNDNKVCFLRLEGSGFGGVKLNLELRLSVEDSPNSAGMVIDAIRLCRIARDRGLSGPILPACAWTMKHPPRQMTDDDARAAVERFHTGTGPQTPVS